MRAKQMRLIFSRCLWWVLMVTGAQFYLITSRLGSGVHYLCHKQVVCIVMKYHACVWEEIQTGACPSTITLMLLSDRTCTCFQSVGHLTCGSIPCLPKRFCLDNQHLLIFAPSMCLTSLLPLGLGPFRLRTCVHTLL